MHRKSIFSTHGFYPPLMFLPHIRVFPPPFLTDREREELDNRLAQKSIEILLET